MLRLPVLLLLTVWTTASALDAPIAGDQLRIVWNPSFEGKLVFDSRDPTFLFPPIGGADDPATGTPGGAVLWLFWGPPPSFPGSARGPAGAGWTSPGPRAGAH